MVGITSEFDPQAFGGRSFGAKFFRYHEVTYIGPQVDLNDSDFNIRIEEHSHQGVIDSKNLMTNIMILKDRNPNEVDCGIVRVNLDVIPPEIIFLLGSLGLGIPTRKTRETTRQRTVDINAAKFPDYKVSS